MGRSVSILTVFFLLTYLSYAGPCPDQVQLMKNLRAKSDLSSKQEIARWLPYLDSLKNCNNANDSVVAYLNKSIGSLFYNDSDYVNAVKYYIKYLDITRTNLGRQGFREIDMMNGYYMYSIMYLRLNMQKERMAALDSCISYADRIKLNNRTNLFALYVNVEYYYDLGDYYRCLDYATRLVAIAKICQDSSDAGLRDDGFRYNSSGTAWKINALNQLGDYVGAEKNIMIKIDELKKLKQTFNLSTWYGLWAEVSVKRKDYAKAIILYKQALEIAKKNGNYFTCKQILNSLGRDVYFNIYHDNGNALKCFREALSFHDNNNSIEPSDKIETLNIYTNIANVFVDNNQFDSAFRFFYKAYLQIQSGGAENQFLSAFNGSLFSQKKTYYVTDLIISKGEAYRKKYLWSGDKQNLFEALRVYRVADQFLNLLRKEQTDMASKLFWRKDSRRLYEKAIDVCYLLRNDAEAFYFFEKSRAALLNDQLTFQRWVGEKEIKQDIQLSKYVTGLQRKINTADQSSKVYDDLIKDKIKKTRELENIRQQIRENNPLYYHNLIDTGTITISNLRNFVLPANGALLETFNGDSAVYILSISAKSNNIKKIDAKEYGKLSSTFIELLSEPADLNKNFNRFRETANALYSLVFEGLNLSAGRVIISPDGPGFPFEALMISKEPVKYFVEDYAVSYTYSAKFLEDNYSGGRTKSNGDFFGLAPLRFNPSFKLSSLEGSDQSLQRINKLFRNSVMITGDKVTPKKFMDEFHQYQVVQLYTHAADSSKFNEPVIYFGDSVLRLSDLVYEESPLTRLMVLSACETGSGKFYRGEGVFSFSRGFAALGIPSSISNLWSVENESTYRLTELFYIYLAEGLPLDISLQKAKLEFMKTSGREKQLPYFWAAQVLSGHTDPISIKKPIPYPIIFTGILATCLVAGIGWKTYRRRKSSRVRDRV